MLKYSFLAVLCLTVVLDVFGWNNLYSASEDTCNFAAAPTVTRTSISTIQYCGRIDREGVAELLHLADVHTRQIEISSSGGGYNAPIDFAEAIHKKGWSVSIIGPCFSGCALLVFSASKSRHVTDLGILGFHNSSSSAALLANRLLGANSFLKTDDPLIRRASRERRLLEAQGVDPSLLYDPQVHIRTTCVFPRGYSARTGEFRVDIHSLNDFWVPTKLQLQEAGLDWTGNLPRDANEVKDRLRAALGIHPEYDIVFGGASPIKHSTSMLYEIPECNVDE